MDVDVDVGAHVGEAAERVLGVGVGMLCILAHIRLKLRWGYSTQGRPGVLSLVETGGTGWIQYQGATMALSSGTPLAAATPQTHEDFFSSFSTLQGSSNPFSSLLLNSETHTQPTTDSLAIQPEPELDEEVPTIRLSGCCIPHPVDHLPLVSAGWPLPRCPSIRVCCVIPLLPYMPLIGCALAASSCALTTLCNLSSTTSPSACRSRA